jgi:hypothetical protein
MCCPLLVCSVGTTENWHVVLLSSQLTRFSQKLINGVWAPQFDLYWLNCWVLFLRTYPESDGIMYTPFFLPDCWTAHRPYQWGSLPYLPYSVVLYRSHLLWNTVYLSIFKLSMCVIAIQLDTLRLNSRLLCSIPSLSLFGNTSKGTKIS